MEGHPPKRAQLPTVSHFLSRPVTDFPHAVLVLQSSVVNRGCLGDSLQRKAMSIELR
jgi:hypothetical protein